MHQQILSDPAMGIPVAPSHNPTVLSPDPEASRWNATDMTDPE